jgi:hypothetical protein
MRKEEGGRRKEEGGTISFNLTYLRLIVPDVLRNIEF